MIGTLPKLRNANEFVSYLYHHNNAFHVLNIVEADSKDLKTLTDVSMDTTELEISKAFWFRVTSENPAQIRQIRRTFSEDWARCNVLEKRKCIQDICSRPIPFLECKNRITPTKLNMLKQQNNIFHYNIIVSMRIRLTEPFNQYRRPDQTIVSFSLVV
ncbi:hypothetical protein JTB14_030448 [Gonioctena quinquepunctata]|nr:hypothetical protein JTB14_030448 [Gonioctena quinquepunctata]